MYGVYASEIHLSIRRRHAILENPAQKPVPPHRLEIDRMFVANAAWSFDIDA
jgi:hypothetical protein